MSDKPLGMIVATVIAAPLMVICCGGGAALIGSAVAGVIGYLTGSGILMVALVAAVGGVGVLAVRSWRRTSKDRTARIERQG